MARCNSCSAPLPANTNKCNYCGTRNDVDLHSKHDYKVSNTKSERICPHCDIPLQTVDLNMGGKLQIERCKDCYGLFFDPGEIETLLKNGVSNVESINRLHIQNINKDRFQKKPKVKYIKCPVCRILMNRVNYGHRSGVIIDSCKKHGVWLDNGEITHLLEWTKAGGQLLHEHESKQKQKQKLSYASSKARSQLTNPYPQHQGNTFERDLLDSVSSVLNKLFG